MALGLLVLADVAVPGFLELSFEQGSIFYSSGESNPATKQGKELPLILELQLRLAFPCLECYGLALPGQSHNSATRAYAPKSFAV